MGFTGLMRRGVALLVVGVVVLSVSCLPCVEGHPPSGKQDHVFTFFQDSPRDSHDVSSEVHVCGATKGGGGSPAQSKLDLTAVVNTPLQFSCKASETLAPNGQAKQITKVEKFYEYNAADGNCNKDEKQLQELGIGATLVTGSEGKLGVQPASPAVYTFNYNSQPNDEKHLCYTCNTGAAAAAHGLRFVAEETVVCTVHIKVPAKTTTPAPLTTDLNSAYDARATTAFLATATGGLLAVILPM